MTMTKGHSEYPLQPKSTTIQPSNKCQVQNATHPACVGECVIIVMMATKHKARAGGLAWTLRSLKTKNVSRLGSRHSRTARMSPQTGGRIHYRLSQLCLTICLDEANAVYQNLAGAGSNSSCCRTWWTFAGLLSNVSPSRLCW